MHKHPDSDCLSFSARMAALQEDNKNLELSLSKMEAERKQAQERSNNLEKVYRSLLVVVLCVHIQDTNTSTL